MGGAVKAEFRKFFTTRLWWGMAIGVFLAGALFSLIFAVWVPGSRQGGGTSGPAYPGLDNAAMINTVYTAGLSLAYLLTLVVGVMSIGSEYRHMTITSTFLATPKRVHVMGAKVLSLLGIGAFYGLVFLVGSVGVGATTIAVKGGNGRPHPRVEPARSRALGTGRAGRRDPDPQPGCRDPHCRGRCLDP
jgi:ABC-2 type transport system permease protein